LPSFASLLFLFGFAHVRVAHEYADEIVTPISSKKIDSKISRSRYTYLEETPRFLDAFAAIM
jgi:hypothetical protein